MNNRETLEEIIKQKGGCVGIWCDKTHCPLRNDNNGVCDNYDEGKVSVYNRAKKMLAEMDKEEVNMSKFKVGDLVLSLLYGWGRIHSIDFTCTHPILVQLEDNQCSFTIEGKSHQKAKYPILFTRQEAAIKFPEYPAPKVKKTLERWVNIYNGGKCDFHESEEDADRYNRHSLPKRIDCQKVTIEYEVEE